MERRKCVAAEATSPLWIFAPDPVPLLSLDILVIADSPPAFFQYAPLSKRQNQGSISCEHLIYPDMPERCFHAVGGNHEIFFPLAGSCAPSPYDSRA